MGTLGTNGPILVFGMGATELLLIAAVILLLFGARKIPEIARGLGRSMSEFKKGMSEGASDDAKGPDSQKESKSDDSGPAPGR